MSDNPKSSWQKIFFTVFLCMFLGAMYLLKSDFQYVGKTVVATAKMTDPTFQHKSVHVLEHTIEGSMGYVIDAPIRQMRFGEFSRIHHLKPKGKKAAMKLVQPAYADDQQDKEANEVVKSEYDDIMVTVYFGGPIDVEKITIIHDGSVMSRDQKRYARQDLVVTDHLGVLYALLEQKEHNKGGAFKIFAGRTKWGSGQLFNEVEQSFWDVTELDHDKIWQEHAVNTQNDLLNQ